MSRRTRERGLEASERWPNLQRLLQECFGGHSPKRSSVQAELDKTIAGWSLEARQSAAREWWDWNATRSWNPDGLSILSDGFGVNVDFEEDGHARRFMSEVYDRLIVSVRAGTGKSWRPDDDLQPADK